MAAAITTIINIIEMMFWLGISLLAIGLYLSSPLLQRITIAAARITLRAIAIAIQSLSHSVVERSRNDHTTQYPIPHTHHYQKRSKPEPEPEVIDYIEL